MKPKEYTTADDGNVSYTLSISSKEQNDAIRNATLELIEAVEQYVRQETSRSTLIWKKEHLKRLLEK